MKNNLRKTETQKRNEVKISEKLPKTNNKSIIQKDLRIKE